MAQFEVIRDIGDTVKEVLKDSFESNGFTTVHVSIDKPKKDNIKNLPTVNAYLYHVSFAPTYKERHENLVSRATEDGKIVEYYQAAPLYLFAHVIINVWGNSPSEENLLLGLAIKTMLDNPILTGDSLKGSSFYPDDRLNIYPNLQSDFNDTLSFWRSLNEEVRPAIYYHIKFRIESDRLSEPIRRVHGKDFAVNRPE
jgi:hypothetical protein